MAGEAVREGREMGGHVAAVAEPGDGDPRRVRDPLRNEVLHAREQVVRVLATHVPHDRGRVRPAATNGPARVRREHRVPGLEEHRHVRAGEGLAHSSHRSPVDPQDRRERWLAVRAARQDLDPPSVPAGPGDHPLRGDGGSARCLPGVVQGQQDALGAVLDHRQAVRDVRPVEGQHDGAVRANRGDLEVPPADHGVAAPRLFPAAVHVQDPGHGLHPADAQRHGRRSSSHRTAPTSVSPDGNARAPDPSAATSRISPLV